MTGSFLQPGWRVATDLFAAQSLRSQFAMVGGVPTASVVIMTSFANAPDSLLAQE